MGSPIGGARGGGGGGALTAWGRVRGMAYHPPSAVATLKWLQREKEVTLHTASCAIAQDRQC